MSAPYFYNGPGNNRYPMNTAECCCTSNDTHYNPCGKNSENLIVTVNPLTMISGGWHFLQLEGVDTETGIYVNNATETISSNTYELVHAGNNDWVQKPGTSYTATVSLSFDLYAADGNDPAVYDQGQTTIPYASSPPWYLKISGCNATYSGAVTISGTSYGGTIYIMIQGNGFQLDCRASTTTGCPVGALANVNWGPDFPITYNGNPNWVWGSGFVSSGMTAFAFKDGNTITVSPTSGTTYSLLRKCQGNQLTTYTQKGSEIVSRQTTYDGTVGECFKVDSSEQVSEWEKAELDSSKGFSTCNDCIEEQYLLLAKCSTPYTQEPYCIKRKNFPKVGQSMDFGTISYNGECYQLAYVSPAIVDSVYGTELMPGDFDVYLNQYECVAYNCNVDQYTPSYLYIKDKDICYTLFGLNQINGLPNPYYLGNKLDYMGNPLAEKAEVWFVGSSGNPSCWKLRITNAKGEYWEGYGPRYSGSFQRDNRNNGKSGGTIVRPSEYFVSVVM